ncbi:hypothetical protein Sjap_005895 [Stephania japonica]|uniref:BSD domain-containing protein n=1 Tax=Stephania japonica TaxID=461633 RepID=A0AAP0K4Z0_9MAGN
MDLSSWARKLLLKKPNDAATATGRRQRSNRESKEEEEEVGLTDELRELVKSFTIETFKSFLFKTITNKQQQQQQRLLEITAMEISQLRYALCPRHLKDSQFWRIYFLLVKSLVSPYELRAIREEKLKRLERQEEKSPNKVFEVEMSEAKQETIGESPTDLPV